jgi:syntaxin 18
MLSDLRRPYLSFEDSDEAQTPGRTWFDVSSSNWSQVNKLTDEERDQIDIRAKNIISMCATRVRNLESLEKSEYVHFICSVR